MFYSTWLMQWPNEDYPTNWTNRKHILLFFNAKNILWPEMISRSTEPSVPKLPRLLTNVYKLCFQSIKVGSFNWIWLGLAMDLRTILGFNLLRLLSAMESSFSCLQWTSDDSDERRQITCDNLLCYYFLFCIDKKCFMAKTNPRKTTEKPTGCNLQRVLSAP